MLSAQGNSQTIKGGMVVLQTIGQQSVNGNATASNLTMQQGFQQSLISQFFPVYNVTARWQITEIESQQTLWGCFNFLVHQNPE